jgi:hypothetical protein
MVVTSGIADERDLTRLSRARVRQRSIDRVRDRVTIGPMRFTLLMAVTIHPALMFGA